MCACLVLLLMGLVLFFLGMILFFKFNMMYILVMMELMFLTFITVVVVWNSSLWFVLIMICVSACESVFSISLFVHYNMYLMSKVS